MTARMTTGIARRKKNELGDLMFMNNMVWFRLELKLKRVDDCELYNKELGDAVALVSRIMASGTLRLDKILSGIGNQPSWHDKRSVAVLTRTLTRMFRRNQVHLHAKAEDQVNALQSISYLDGVNFKL